MRFRKSIADEKAKKSGDSNGETTEVRKVTLFTKHGKRSKHKASSYMEKGFPHEPFI